MSEGIVDPRTGLSSQSANLAKMAYGWLKSERVSRALVSTRKASPQQLVITIARLKATLDPNEDSTGLRMTEHLIATLIDICLENSQVRKAIARDAMDRYTGLGKKGILSGLKDLRTNVRREYGLDAEAQGIVVS